MQLNQSQRSFFNGGRGLGFGVLAHIKYPNYKLSLYWKILFGLAKSCMKIFLSYSNPSENIMRYLPFPNLHGYAGKHFAPKKNWLIKFQVEWKNVLRKHANLKWKRIPIPWSTVLRHYCAMHSNRNWNLIAIKLTIKSNQIKCKKWKKIHAMHVHKKLKISAGIFYLRIAVGRIGLHLSCLRLQRYTNINTIFKNEKTETSRLVFLPWNLTQPYPVSLTMPVTLL